jgi:hypothetical protein
MARKRNVRHYRATFKGTIADFGKVEASLGGMMIGRKSSATIVEPCSVVRIVVC